MQTAEKRGDENWTLGPGPFTVSGRPAFLKGVVELINNTAENRELTAISLRNVEIRSHRGPVPDHVTLLAQLGPYTRRRTSTRLALDPVTAPGRYEALLCCGAQTERLLIQVLPNWQLRIVPDAISLATSAGEKLKVPIVIINEGNMELTLPTTQSVDLDDNRGVIPMVKVVVREVGKDGFNKCLDRFVQDWAKELVEPAVVRIGPRHRPIRPGETSEVELAIELPMSLKKGRDYKGRIRFKNASLSLKIECS